MDIPEDIQEIRCSVSEINQRIYPIHYINGVLVIDSDVSVNNISADGATIQDLEITNLNVSGGIVPSANTTYDLGSQTNWFANVYANEIYTSGGSVYVGGARLTANGDVFQLPTKTTIDGWPVLNTDYFYFFSNRSTFPAGEYMVVGGTISVAPPPDTRCFPFVAPTDCVLTSILLSFAVGPGTSTITNVEAYVDLLDTEGNLTENIAYATIPSCPVNTKRYAETTFQRVINKGDSVGVYIFYTGTSTTRTPSVVLGYKRIPPTPVYTSPFLSLSLTTPFLSGHYYRSDPLVRDPYEDPILMETASKQEEEKVPTSSVPDDVSERRRRASAIEN